MPGKNLDTYPFLTPRRQRFVEEYLIDLSATQAAIRAGYSRKTAGSQGERLLKNVEVRQAIGERMKERSAQTGITSEQVLRTLWCIATADIGGAFDENGGLKPIDEMPEYVRQAIAGIEILEKCPGRSDDRTKVVFTKRIRFCDKVRALELVGKHLKLFTEKIEHSGPDGGVIAFSDLERANRLRHLVELAAKRASEAGGVKP